MNNIKIKNGFTLLELLVVIAIIIILASISVITLNGQRAKARDAKRISDVRQIRTALEFYYSDEGEYPINTQAIILGSKGALKLCSKIEGGFVTMETQCSQETTYMSLIPDDPNNKYYMFSSDGKGYDIAFMTEKPSSLGPQGMYHAHSESIDSSAGYR